MQAIAIVYSPSERWGCQCKLIKSGGQIRAVFWKRGFRDVLMNRNHSFLCVCICICGKGRIKNDSQVSVCAIYWNGEQWVEGVWLGMGGLVDWGAGRFKNTFLVMVTLKYLWNTTYEKVVVHMRLGIWRQISEFGSHYHRYVFKAMRWMRSFKEDADGETNSLGNPDFILGIDRWL